MARLCKHRLREEFNVPFRSVAQRKFMMLKHPTIAAKWRKKYGSGKELPQRIGAMKKKTGMVAKIKHKFLRRSRYKLLGK